MKIRHAVILVPICFFCFLAGRVSGQAAKPAGLQRFVGTFDVSGKMWMRPGQPPFATKATAVFKPVLGGRFVRQDYSDPRSGVSGVGFMGFHPGTKSWSSIWMYNMDPQMEYSSGTADKDGVLQLSGAKRGKATRRYEHRWTDADTRVLSSWWELPDGKKSMVYKFTYLRRKK